MLELKCYLRILKLIFIRSQIRLENRYHRAGHMLSQTKKEEGKENAIFRESTTLRENTLFPRRL